MKFESGEAVNPQRVSTPTKVAETRQVILTCALTIEPLLHLSYMTYSVAGVSYGTRLGACALVFELLSRQQRRCRRVAPSCWIKTAPGGSWLLPGASRVIQQPVDAAWEGPGVMSPPDATALLSGSSGDVDASHCG